MATASLGTESPSTMKLPIPSTSASGSPASSTAARHASVARSSTLRPDFFVSPVKPIPAIAASRFTTAQTLRTGPAHCQPWSRETSLASITDA